MNLPELRGRVEELRDRLAMWNQGGGDGFHVEVTTYAKKRKKSSRGSISESRRFR